MSLITIYCALVIYDRVTACMNIRWMPTDANKQLFLHTPCLLLSLSNLSFHHTAWFSSVHRVNLNLKVNFIGQCIQIS